ncbi:sulfur carrier protein ThiS [Vogesella sp. LIG4]|uniref:sulfur carrier protein ThiS n=1 Tax=Vogesella sp. LIG4 TaxID=1192162 RepID=UPI00081FEE71|nr:sulfur carrier protein ThiS [Vogesella sp. LIG4]SCK17031.1 sulfur carrier protein [Vogesella sp. LIG4]
MPLITLNGESRQFAPSVTTLTALIAALELHGKRIAIERNGEIVPRSQHADTALLDGDALEIVVAVGGG